MWFRNAFGAWARFGLTVVGHPTPLFVRWWWSPHRKWHTSLWCILKLGMYVQNPPCFWSLLHILWKNLSTWDMCEALVLPQSLAGVLSWPIVFRVLWDVHVPLSLYDPIVFKVREMIFQHHCMPLKWMQSHDYLQNHLKLCYVLTFFRHRKLCCWSFNPQLYPVSYERDLCGRFCLEQCPHFLFVVIIVYYYIFLFCVTYFCNRLYILWLSAV